MDGWKEGENLAEGDVTDAEQFPDEADDGDGDGITDAISQGVKGGIEDIVLAGEGFSSSQDDAVDDKKTQEDT